MLDFVEFGGEAGSCIDPSEKSARVRFFATEYAIRTACVRRLMVDFTVAYFHTLLKHIYIYMFFADNLWCSDPFSNKNRRFVSQRTSRHWGFDP